MRRMKRLKRKDKSTLSKIEYIIDHFLFGALLGYDCFKLIFINLVSATYLEHSIPEMCVCISLTSLLGFLSSYEFNRTGKEVLIDIISGIGLYVVIALGKCIPRFILILVAVMVWSVIACRLAIICRRFMKKYYAVYRTNNRIYRKDLENLS